MSHVITGIDSHSPAARAGLCVDDRLLSINGEADVDFIDYQALTAQSKLKLRVNRKGQILDIAVRKAEYTPLGLNFSSPMMSGTRLCCNKCLFCFVDQLPPNVRETMRVKDDDWRMSLMMGNYVTLTNVSDRELKRIVARHASPLYISVHAVNPDLRTQILGTPRAARLMDQLKLLSDGGIAFHCQAVLCPGLNDGPALEETIRTLAGLPGAKSLALVPVGLTSHRNGLYDLHAYRREEARSVLELAERWREKLLKARGTRFVFPSDEFYLAADWPIPEDDAYEGYDQIDDGVGLLRCLRTEYAEAWEELPESERRPTPDGMKIAIACGQSAAAFLRQMMQDYPVSGANISVYALKNTFFGPSVTVSGLITGGDLTAQMANVEAEAILITECMLRNEGDRFLDDMPLTEVRQRLGRPVIPVGRQGEDLLNAILNLRGVAKLNQ